MRTFQCMVLFVSMSLLLLPAGVTAQTDGQVLPIQPGQTLRGLIATPQDEQAYVFTAERGQTVEILMAGEPSLDPYLILIDPDGNWVAVDDDSGPLVDALIETTLLKTGMYTIIARNARRLTTGWYELSLNVMDTTLPDDPDDGRWLYSGAIFDGTINTFGDEDTSYFEAEAGKIITLSMTSLDALDSSLILIGPDGHWLATDDNSGTNIDASIYVVAPLNGVYTVIASSFSDIKIGSYTVTLMIY
ncbi:MAG: hypothetical protein HC837_20115 [Chloroflexaceae bacterium]|nr:hypothetical protein [Chloroflexaceae bacterium]